MSQPTWTSNKLSDCVSNGAQSVQLPLPTFSSSLPGFFLFLLIALCFSGCCAKPAQHSSGVLFTTGGAFEESLVNIPPAFYIKSGEKPYNKIGTPAVTEKDGSPFVQVDSTTPSIYVEKSTFTTTRNTYTNHIYRIHFSGVPFGWCNLNITTGKNPGLLLIYTFNPEDKLVLITTVHTCGCYLAFFPTKDLAKESYPPNWPEKTQSVHGYTLPAIIPAQLRTDPHPYYFTLESGSHRISHVSHASGADPNQVIGPLMKIEPMENLYHLPYKGENKSFFENRGRRAGYVKNNTKILERLLISWWAFDLYVGEDKAYGGSDPSITPFYTSLKFWQRSNSDMKNFPGFLSYWGWSL